MAGHDQSNLTIKKDDFIEVPFIMIPERLTEMDVVEGLPANFISVYVMINKCRASFCNESYISIDMFYYLYGYVEKKTNYHRPKLFNDIVTCLNFLNERHYITIYDTELNSQLQSRSMIKIIVNESFDRLGKYVLMRIDEYRHICEIALSNKIDIDSILKVFTEIKYVINTTKKQSFFIKDERLSNRIKVKQIVIKRIIDLLCSETKTYPSIFIKKLDSEMNIVTIRKNSKYIEELNEKKHQNSLAENQHVTASITSLPVQDNLEADTSDDPDDFDNIWGDAED